MPIQCLPQVLLINFPSLGGNEAGETIRFIFREAKIHDAVGAGVFVLMHLHANRLANACNPHASSGMLFSHLSMMCRSRSSTRQRVSSRTGGSAVRHFTPGALCCSCLTSNVCAPPDEVCLLHLHIVMLQGAAGQPCRQPAAHGAREARRHQHPRAPSHAHCDMLETLARRAFACIAPLNPIADILRCRHRLPFERRACYLQATNRPQELDEAMHRRITMAFEFRKPDHVQAGSIACGAAFKSCGASFHRL